MGPPRSRARAGVLVAAIAAAVGAAGGASAGPGIRGFEQDVSATGDWHAGEPAIVSNPRDPRNVVMVWPEENASGVYRNPATGTFDTATGTVLGYANDPAFSRCGLAVSYDGGKRWRRSVLPAQTAQSTLCSDATLAAGPDGTFYAAVITFHQPTSPVPLVTPSTLPQVSTMQPGQGSGDAVLVSRDGGRTWSYPPVDAIANRGEAARRYAPGSNPEAGGEGTCDRPWIRVDQKTGTVYVIATADFIQFNGSTRIESWVTTSRNRARSFGTVYPVDTPAWQQTGPSMMDAAHGQLAVAYVGKAPGRSSDVVVFETSRDGGRTFTRHVLAAPVSGGVSPFGINLAADPHRAGHYAVLVPGTGETGGQVYRTADGGRSWSGPATTTIGTNRTWMAFAPSTGALAVMGRDVHSDGSQDVLAAFSVDGGQHFGAALRVNHATAPPLPAGTLSLYDDDSWISLTDRYAYLAWGDPRKTRRDPNGEVNVWMARVPLP